MNCFGYPRKYSQGCILFLNGGPVPTKGCPVPTEGCPVPTEGNPLASDFLVEQ